MVQAGVGAGPPGGGQPGPEGLCWGPGPGGHAGILGPLQVGGIGGQDEGALWGSGPSWGRAGGCTEVLAGGERGVGGSSIRRGNGTQMPPADTWAHGLATTAATPPGSSLNARQTSAPYVIYAWRQPQQKCPNTSPAILWGSERSRALCRPHSWMAGASLGADPPAPPHCRSHFSWAQSFCPEAHVPYLRWGGGGGAGADPRGRGAPRRGQLQGPPAGPDKCFREPHGDIPVGGWGLRVPGSQYPCP